MMEITAALVKELRERTSAGMMECKKALKECNGDIEAAIELMRKSGLAQAAKKAGRIAAEGLIIIQQVETTVGMVEVNCETDFVSRGDDFKGFCNAIVKLVLEMRPANLDALLKLPFSSGGRTVEETRQDLIAKIGENINVRRFTTVNVPQKGHLGIYLHGIRIGVLVEVQGGTAELAKDIAMHIAASRPVCVTPEQVSPELIAKEREIYTAQAKESGKPDNIVEKMVNGRVQKFLGEITLLGQPFVKNPDITVKKLLEEHQAVVVRFERFEVGEGIEKKTANFADEVRCQVQGH
jgi:elongation factor Ts